MTLARFGMSKAGCFGLHEANDVSRGEPMKLDFTLAEGLPKKSSNRIAIQTSRGGGEPALAQQILLERLSEPDERARVQRAVPVQGSIQRRHKVERIQRSV